MNFMNKSNWMAEVGISLVNAILLAGLPLALISVIVAAF